MRPNTTALIIPADQITSLLQPFRDRHIHTPAVAVPAHITLHVPFKPLTEIDDMLITTLTQFFAQTARFRFILQATNRFSAAGVLYLAPEPAAPFLALSRHIQQHYPDAVPDFPDPIMHLTIAQGYSEDALTRVEDEFHRDYDQYLPCHAIAHQACLYIKRAGVWSKHSDFAFAETLAE